MIVAATPSDIPDILNMTQACRLHMESKGIFQWTTSYPNKEKFRGDVGRGELYVLKNNNTIIGCVVLSIVMDAEYKTVKWLTANHNNLYIHRLAVRPNYQGQGFAQELMDFGENMARAKHFASIRLDTFSQNKRNRRFYEQRGYQKLEDIHFPDQSEYPFHCYELLL